MDRFGRLAPLNSLFSPVETLLDVAIPVFELMEVPAPSSDAWTGGRTSFRQTG